MLAAFAAACAQFRDALLTGHEGRVALLRCLPIVRGLCRLSRSGDAELLRDLAHDHPHSIAFVALQPIRDGFEDATLFITHPQLKRACPKH